MQYIYIYILFVVVYACLVVYNSSMPFMAGDDINFYTTLREGEQVWHGLAVEVGRFFPLAGWNLNLVALFSTSPYAFMIGNACVFVVTAWAFWRVGMALGISPLWVCLAFIGFSLSAGYAHIVVAFCYPELTEIMFLLLFLLVAVFYYKSKKIQWLILALFFGNACIYLKEVAFIFIGGFGFLHLFFTLWNEKFGFNLLDKRIVFFDVLCMLSGIIFLMLYAYFALGGKGAYISIIPFYSLLNTLVVLFLATPVVGILLPSALIFRLYRILRYKESLNPVGDSIGVIALVYFAAYIYLGMAAFHYFSPANILAFLYVCFCVCLYVKSLNFLLARVILCMGAFLLLTSAIPQGLSGFTTYKTQSKNTQDAFDFLAEYIRKSPTQVNLYFDGFCRSFSKCANSYWYYPALFQTLPKYYGITDNYDIKSKEENGGQFRIDSNSPFTFYNSDEVSQPQSGDLVILHYASSKYMTPSDIQDIVAQYETLFVSSNYPYYPMYNLMSLGALVLKKLGISTSFDNRGNIFKLPSQVYVLRVP